MKFGRLFEMADEKDCAKVVTGHYARIEKDEAGGTYRLKRAIDRMKGEIFPARNIKKDEYEPDEENPRPAPPELRISIKTRTIICWVCSCSC